MAAAALPAADRFVAGLVDYAGLFPPAALDMAAAVHNYSAYRSDPHAGVLGRFVVPVARLHEFLAAAGPLLPRRHADAPWRLTALGSGNPTADVQALAAVGALLPHRGRPDGGDVRVEVGAAPVIVDALEVKATTVDAITAVRAAVPRTLELFVEIPAEPDPQPLLAALAGANAGAKLRTGGVTPDAIPATPHVARFLVEAAGLRLPFKATAGLHHAIRGSYSLTYAPDSPRAVMHGFINVFAAAVLARAGGSLHDVTGLLDETEVAAFRFGPTGLRWRDRLFSTAQLDDARQHFARSFGSCSFREPIQDLHAWGLL